MGFKNLLPFKIVKNGKEMIQDTSNNVQQGVQQGVQSVGNKTGFLNRMLRRPEKKTNYQIWMEGAANRRESWQDRYAKMRGWK